LATGKHILKPAGKEVKVMKPTRKEYEQRRQELLNLLYTMVDELEHNPTLHRRKAGLPFDMLESIVYQMLTALEGAVNRWAVPGIEKRLEWLKERWERLRH
jgi:hypothetical protein